MLLNSFFKILDIQSAEKHVVTIQIDPTHEIFKGHCTYNNEKTLEKVISDVLAYSNDVIVVNDGSTDSTPEIVKKFSNIVVISYLPNKGKGKALRTGIRYAQEKGFDYAITIDSDGQHF